MRRFLAAYVVLMLGVLALSAQGIPFIRNYMATEYKGHNQNFDIITGSDGTVYVANFEGLLYYDNASWHMLHTPGVSRITAVFRDSKGTIWTGGYNYIGHLKTKDNGQLALHTINEAKDFRGEVQWIWEKSGAIYFLVSDKKIYAVRNNNVIWAAGEQLPQSGYSVLGTEQHVNQVQQIENGLKAVATNGQGIIIIDSKGNELFRVTEENGLCSNNVSHIAYNGHGMLWGATDNGVFCMAFPSVYTHFTSREGLRGEVLSIGILGSDVFVGTQRGLYHLKGKRFDSVEGINHACWQLVQQNNTLLAATANGVYRVDKSNRAVQLTTNNTLSLMVDGDAYYSGESDGVFIYDGSRRLICDVDKVVKIMRDASGSIWLQNLYGSIWHDQGGHGFTTVKVSDDADEMATLVPYDDKELLIVTVSEESPLRYPLYSYRDAKGLLWLTDNKGKNVYAMKDGMTDVKMTKLVSPLANNFVRSILHDGDRIWIGGDKGLNLVNTTMIDPSQKVRQRLIIRSFTIHGDSVVWGGYGKMPEMLPTLSSNDRHITIDYSVDFPSLLQHTRYRHRLNGGAWSPWEYDTYEEYPSLTYGSYTFEVQARDAYGRETDIVAVNFQISHPIYMRWYMVVLYIILLAAIVYGLFRLRLHQLERDKIRLENVIKERSAEVVRLEKQASVGKLTQGLIDRILNPLNYINNFAKLSEGLVKDLRANVEDEQERMNPDNYEDTLEVLDMLKSNMEKVGEHGANTTRTLKAMEELLKDRSGSMKPLSLTALITQDEEMLRKYFEKDIARYGISITFSVPAEEIRINGNSEQLSKTFMSILANAVYAVCKKAQRMQFSPEISLTVTKHHREVILRFHDNGIGIEQTIIDKIFDPFFTTKTTGEASGVGLYLSREIAQNHGGDITVRSEKDVQTELTVTLPTL